MVVFYSTYTLRCPHCGGVYMTGAGNGPEQKIGKPLITCKYCQRPFVGNDKEWIMLSEKERKTYMFRRFVNAIMLYILGGMLSLFSIAPFTAEAPEAGAVILGIGLLLLGLAIFFNVRANTKEIDKRLKAINESIKRTNDPEYFEYIKNLSYGILYPVESPVFAKLKKEKVIGTAEALPKQESYTTAEELEKRISSK